MLMALGGAAGLAVALRGLHKVLALRLLRTVPDFLECRRERIGVAEIVVSACVAVVAGKRKTAAIALNHAPAADDFLVADCAQHGENVGSVREYNPKSPVRDRVGEWQLVEVQEVLPTHYGDAAKHDRFVEAFACHSVADRFYAKGAPKLHPVPLLDL